jgi:hypothetical protein
MPVQANEVAPAFCCLKHCLPAGGSGTPVILSAPARCVRLLTFTVACSTLFTQHVSGRH